MMQIFTMAVKYEKQILAYKDEIAELKADKARLIEALEFYATFKFNELLAEMKGKQ